MAELLSVNAAAFALGQQVFNVGLDAARGSLIEAGYTPEQARQIVARGYLSAAASLAISLGQPKEAFAADLEGFASRIRSGEAEEDAKARREERRAALAARINSASPDEIEAAIASLPAEEQAWARAFEAKAREGGK